MVTYYLHYDNEYDLVELCWCLFLVVVAKALEMGIVWSLAMVARSWLESCNPGHTCQSHVILVISESCDHMIWPESCDLTRVMWSWPVVLPWPESCNAGQSCDPPEHSHVISDIMMWSCMFSYVTFAISPEHNRP